MKIKVADLEPNPFRQIGKYPIDKRKLESLKLSISETSFWDNVLCRRHGKKYEIAYGHHRLEALKELGIEEVDIPVKNLSNAQMIRIMAEENLEWLTSPKVIYQTVITVKEFLDGELAKYKTWEESRSNKTIRGLFKSENEWSTPKGKGVGQTTILKFLGGNWKQGKIQAACKANQMMKDKKLDMDAVLKFDKIDQAKQFQDAVDKFDIPIEKQAKIVDEVKENIKRKKTVTDTHRERHRKMTIADDVVKQIGSPKTKRAKKNEVLRIAKALSDIEKQARILADRLEGLRIDIKKLGIEEITGLKPALAKFALKRLYKEMKIWKGLKNEQLDSRNRRISGNVIG